MKTFRKTLKKSFKKTIIALFCFVLIVSCSACNKKLSLNPEMKYELKNIEDSAYLLIDENLSLSEVSDKKVIYFENIDDFFNTVNNGWLSEKELAIANREFQKDSNGIKVCDFSKLQKPIIPDGLDCRKVGWQGEKYYFFYTSSDNTVVKFNVITKEEFEDSYGNNDVYVNEVIIDEFFNNNVSLNQTIEKEDSTEYHIGSQSKVIGRNILNNDTSLNIYEYECLDAEMNIGLSAFPPSMINFIEIYGTKGDAYFYIRISGYESAPTVEWLSQFGIEDYKEVQ